MSKTAKYGSKGQQWDPKFIEYIEFIAHHEVYKGMPDAFKDDGLIQWEAPSNRQSGKFKDTHHKRREWWRQKAIAVGINPNSAQWISRTAKLIHPTGVKVCKRCGRTMEIRYAYPNRHLLNRISKLDYIETEFELTQLEHLNNLVTRVLR